MNDWIAYAAIILVVIDFFYQHNVFVRPQDMTDRFVSFENHLEKKFVQKETYNVAISEIKLDIEDIKDKLDKIYEKLMEG